MKLIFDQVNSFFDFIVPISDFMWEFPTNLSWYAGIPVLGYFPLSLLILLGAGAFFTVKLKFLQVRSFGRSVKMLTQRKTDEIGVSLLSSFLLSSAMRIGPGNIMGVTGAIAIGGPGALFWMWFCAFLGMATAYVESVLAQIFKEKKNNEYVGGTPFYGRALLGGKVWIGNAIAIIVIIAFLMNIPGQTFHLYTALGSAATIITGVEYDRASVVYYVIAILLLILVPAIVYGGIKRVARLTDKMVPVMASIYFLMVVVIVLFNLNRVPTFFIEVFGGAFSSRAVFGGVFGTVLIQGIKRGLMSNEAGQGTITPAAAVSENKHPCEQGFIQSIGVFLDTMIICTLTGFVVVMASLWSEYDSVQWVVERQNILGVYLSSLSSLVPQQQLNTIVRFIVSVCYALFAFTSLLGMVSFSEISVNRISKSKLVVNFIRIIGSVGLVGFGCLTVLAGLQLGNLWYISDLSNVILVFVNVPLILIGFKMVKKATDHYFKTGGVGFNSLQVLNIETDTWNK